MAGRNRGQTPACTPILRQTWLMMMGANQADEVPAAQADDVLAAQVDQVLAASRVLIGIAAQSIATVDRSISLPQMRALVILVTKGELGLSGLAKAMGVHSSNATRACDGLVASGFVDRLSDPGDRRHVRLVPTVLGRKVFDEITERRRIAIAEVLRTLAPSRRVAVARALQEFSRAGEEIASLDMLTLGWGAGKTSPPGRQDSAGT